MGVICTFFPLYSTDITSEESFLKRKLVCLLVSFFISMCAIFFSATESRELTAVCNAGGFVSSIEWRPLLFNSMSNHSIINIYTLYSLYLRGRVNKMRFYYLHNVRIVLHVKALQNNAANLRVDKFDCDYCACIECKKILLLLFIDSPMQYCAIATLSCLEDDVLLDDASQCSEYHIPTYLLIEHYV